MRMLKRVLCCSALRRQRASFRNVCILFVFVTLVVITVGSIDEDGNIFGKWKSIVPNTKQVIDLFDSDSYHLLSRKSFYEPDSDSLLICVSTSVKNFIRRQAIRDTYGSLRTVNNTEIIILFFVGKTQNADHDRMLKSESSAYNDIIQADYEDTYRNLTLKSMSMLRYVKEYYNNATYIVKLDDDTLLNLPLLIKHFKSLSTKRRLLFGRLFKSVRPERSWRSKYYVSRAEYKLQFYPDYLAGNCYVMSVDVAMSIWDICKNETMVAMEDVFVTGYCAKLVGLTPTLNEQFFNNNYPANACNFTNWISSHYDEAKEMIQIWTDLRNNPSVCDSKMKRSFISKLVSGIMKLFWNPKMKKVH